MSLFQEERATAARSRRSADMVCAATAVSSDPGADRARTLFDVIVGTVIFLGLLLLFLLKAPGIEFFLSSRDHGYQLSIGIQVLLGKVPGFDLPIAYGPLVMYTSALGLWLTHSLIGETFLCSTGYALSVFLLYHLVSRYTSKWLGLVAAGFGLLLQARFYKWYLWLIPMAILWTWHRYLNCPPARRWRWVVAGGSILGICWLYRPDFGTTNLLACLVFLGLVEASEPPREAVRVLRALGLFVASFSVFPLAWLGYLVTRCGVLAPLTYFGNTVQAALSIAGGMSQPPPPIRSVILAYWLMPVSYLLALAMVWQRSRTRQLDARSWFLLVSALIGIACLHQAMHRMDPAHLLQVVPAAIICASLIASALFSGAEGLSRSLRVKTLIRVAGLGYSVLLVAIGLKLSHWGQPDLQTLLLWPLDRYSSLADPQGRSDRNPRLAALSSVTKLTNPGEPILVFPIECQYYALTQRRISGRQIAYFAGLFDSPHDRERNLKAIRDEMPKLIIVPSDFQTGPDITPDKLVGEGRRAHQNIEDFIRQEYPRVVVNEGGIVVLSR